MYCPHYFSINGSKKPIATAAVFFCYHGCCSADTALVIASASSFHWWSCSCLLLPLRLVKIPSTTTDVLFPLQLVVLPILYHLPLDLAFVSADDAVAAVTLTIADLITLLTLLLLLMMKYPIFLCCWVYFKFLLLMLLLLSSLLLLCFWMTVLLLLLLPLLLYLWMLLILILTCTFSRSTECQYVLYLLRFVDVLPTNAGNYHCCIFPPLITIPACLFMLLLLLLHQLRAKSICCTKNPTLFWVKR